MVVVVSLRARKWRRYRLQMIGNRSFCASAVGARGGVVVVQIRQGWLLCRITGLEKLCSIQNAQPVPLPLSCKLCLGKLANWHFQFVFEVTLWKPVVAVFGVVSHLQLHLHFRIFATWQILCWRLLVSDDCDLECQTEDEWFWHAIAIAIVIAMPLPEKLTFWNPLNKTIGG